MRKYRNARTSLWLSPSAWLGVTLLTVLLLVVFSDVISLGHSLYSPDGAPFYRPDHRIWTLLSFWGRWQGHSVGMGLGGLPFHPSRLLELILPPLVYHQAVYVVDIILVCLAGVYYLRGRGVCGVPAWAGGLAMAFAGYFFTLISAGHRDIFDMMPYMVLLFGAIDRALARRSLFYFALSGACAAFGLAVQPDVTLLFLLLALAYAVFRFVRCWPPGSASVLPYLRHSVGGGVVALCFLILLSLGTLGHIGRTVLPTRAAQIGSGRTAQEKWEFATNWSMPPEELLEFIAPCVYGIETGDRRGPYWGRLGRSPGWKPSAAGLMNLRQHTVYVGVFQLLFAAFVVVRVLQRRGEQDDVDEACDGDRALPRSEVLFWGCAAVVCCLLAMGRFFPLYRVFYHAIPKASEIRCPVKFVHLLNVCVSVLFAYGLTVFATDAVTRSARRTRLVFAVVSCVIGCLLFLGAETVINSAADLRSHWETLRLGGYSEVMLSCMKDALLHGGLLFLLASATFSLAGRFVRTSRGATILVSLILVVVGADLASVGRNYISTADLAPFYAANPVAERIKASPGMGRASYFLGPRQKPSPQWINLTRRHLVDMAEPPQNIQLPLEYRSFLQAVGSNIFRFWTLTNTRFVLGAVRQFGPLEEQGAIQQIMTFNVTDGRVVETAGKSGVFGLYGVKGGLPRATLFHSWETMDHEAALKRLAAPDWNPLRTVLVSSEELKPASSDQPPRIVQIEKYGRTEIVLRVQAPEPGVVVLADAYDKDWHVSVNGGKKDVLRCNYLFRGVRVEEGDQRIVFTYRPYVLQFLCSMGAVLVLVMWGLRRLLVPSMKRRGAGFPKGKSAAKMASVCAWLMLGVFVVGCGTEKKGMAFDLSQGLNGLTNIADLAVAPLGRAGLVSTYDHTGGNRDWATWAEVGEDGLIDLADLEGPGCVRRIWMTHVKADKWLFFFDGETEPRLSMTRAELFGGRFPFVPPLSGRVSGGNYCYLPLPYRKSLRIAVRPADLKPGNRAYYHIGYESFPSGATVTSFPASLSEPECNAVDAVSCAWKQNDQTLLKAADRCDRSFCINLAPRQETPWIEHEGAGELTAFHFKIDYPEEMSTLNRARMLRALVLRLYWDGLGQPSVDVPLGDFFCNAFYSRRYSSIALGNVDGRFICRFRMPFGGKVRGVIRNDSSVPLPVSGGYALRYPSAEEARYFHATWKSDISRGAPFQILRATGAGHFVGCFLSCIGIDGSWTILEGDESFLVDGESTPSIHGTGLEDYFNGAWYYTGLFDLPLHGLVEKAPIRTDQYRFHLSDPVAFSTGLEMLMEFGAGNRARGYMSSVAYWYQDCPVGVASATGDHRLRFPPPDPLEPHAIMAHLFELERAGLYQEARERCLAYADKFWRKGKSDALLLRADAYQELLEGYDMVRGAYVQHTSKSSSEEVRHQAHLLQQFHASPTNALFGVQIGGPHRLYLDGRLLSDVSSPNRMVVSPVSLAPGDHSLAMEIHPARRGVYASLCLRGHTTNITSACSWRYTEKQPEGWPRVDSSGGAWQDFPASRVMYPTMGFWQFEPNAFVGMESGRQVLALWPDYSATPKYSSIYLHATVRVRADGKAEFAALPRGGEREKTEEDFEHDQGRSIDRP